MAWYDSYRGDEAPYEYDENGNIVAPRQFSPVPPAAMAQPGTPRTIPVQSAPAQAPARAPAPAAANAPVPRGTPAERPGLLGRLFGGDLEDTRRKLGYGMLAMSNNPQLQQMGIGGLDRMEKLATSRGVQNRTLEALRKMGLPEGQIEVLAQNPELLKEVFKEMYKAKFGGGDVPAEWQTFQKMTEGMSPEQIQQAKMISLGLTPRAASSLSITPEMLMERAFMQSIGKGTGEAEVKAAEEAGARAAGTRMFEFGLQNLEEALTGTVTGSAFGWLPAITSSQQAADQAVALMAPILKQTFRAAGEGAFTDQDQKLLLDMLPDRGTAPEQIANAIKAVQQLVQLKLASGGSEAAVSDLASRYGIGMPAKTEKPSQTTGSSGFTVKGVR